MAKQHKILDQVKYGTGDDLIYSNIVLGAGSATAATWPRIESGTVLTTPEAGAIEYDGSLFYLSPAASQRAVVPVTQYARARAAVSLGNDTSAHSAFAAANDTLTVLGGSLYRVEFNLFLTTGGTSHTTSFGFGGTATATSVQITLSGRSAADNTLAAPQTKEMESLSAVVVTAASTAVTTSVWGRGLIETNAAGTLIPQITFSADPTGTCQTEIGSYFLLQLIGTTNASLGPWA